MAPGAPLRQQILADGGVRQAALGLALRGREGDETGPHWSSRSGYLADSAPGHAADHKEFCRLQIHLYWFIAGPRYQPYLSAHKLQRPD